MLSTPFGSGQQHQNLTTDLGQFQRRIQDWITYHNHDIPPTIMMEIIHHVWHVPETILVEGEVSLSVHIIHIIPLYILWTQEWDYDESRFATHLTFSLRTNILFEWLRWHGSSSTSHRLGIHTLAQDLFYNGLLSKLAELTQSINHSILTQSINSHLQKLISEFTKHTPS